MKKNVPILPILCALYLYLYVFWSLGLFRCPLNNPGKGVKDWLCLAFRCQYIYIENWGGGRAKIWTTHWWI